MKSRAQAQSDYWAGGTIGGVVFHPLNLDRVAILQSIDLAGMTSARSTRVAMAVYALSDDGAAGGEATWDAIALEDYARNAGIGRLSMPEIDEFNEGFAKDLAAIQANQADDGTAALPDGPEADFELPSVGPMHGDGPALEESPPPMPGESGYESRV